MTILLDTDTVPSSNQALPNAPAVGPSAKGRSPALFKNHMVPHADLCALFEAAPPTASPTAELPWRFLVANRSDPLEFGRLLSCLALENQTWAKDAPVLVLSIVALRFSGSEERSHEPLRGLGLACAKLAMAAMARGLSVHQGIGILPNRVRDLYGVPEYFEAWTYMSIGYPENRDQFPTTLPQRELTPPPQLTHNLTQQFVFTGSWGQPTFQSARH